MKEVFIVMEKDAETGLILSEVTSLSVEYADYIAGLHCVRHKNEAEVYDCKLFLTVARDVSDGEYDDVFDYYDGGVLTAAGVVELSEVTEYEKPVWEAVFSFSAVDSLEAKINNIVTVHKKETEDVFIVLQKV
jgi:hypothetical protein